MMRSERSPTAVVVFLVTLSEDIGSAMQGFISRYFDSLSAALSEQATAGIEELATALLAARREGRNVFVCGNGGSAANSIHMVNDLISSGIRATSLAANQSVMTCIANDFSYEEVFSRQLAVLGARGDLLVVMSGSGNSPNALRVVEEATHLGIRSFGVLGYDGGKALSMVDVAIHYEHDDMEQAEDFQLILNHMLRRWLKAPEQAD